jgi:DNA-binding transcriptional LysR family regulator
MNSLAARERRGLRSTLPEGTTAPEIRVDTFALVLPVVLQSDAIGGAAPSQVRGWIANGEVIVLPLELPWLKTNYGIIRLANRTPSPAAESFMQILREVEAGIE